MLAQRLGYYRHPMTSYAVWRRVRVSLLLDASYQPHNFLAIPGRADSFLASRGWTKPSSGSPTIFRLESSGSVGEGQTGRISQNAPLVSPGKARSSVRCAAWPSGGCHRLLGKHEHLVAELQLFQQPEKPQLLKQRLPWKRNRTQEDAKLCLLQ